jgi:hypothetical protein
MVGDVFFVSYVNIVGSKTHGSDLICTPCASRCYVHLICFKKLRYRQFESEFPQVIHPVKKAVFYLITFHPPRTHDKHRIDQGEDPTYEGLRF